MGLRTVSYLNLFLVSCAFVSTVLAQECKQKRVVLLQNRVVTKTQADIFSSFRSRVSSDPCVALVDVDDYLEAGASPAQMQVEEGEQALALGQKQFLDGQISSACPILSKAVNALTMGYPYLVYPAPLVDALMLYGACSSMLSNIEDAKKAFSMAIRLNPAVDVKDYSVAGEALAVFEEVKKSKGRAKGMLEIVSTPDTAEVFVDNQRKGVAPLVGLEVEDGYHFVVVRKQGYMRAFSVASVSAGKTTKIELSLSPARRKPLLDIALAKVSAGAPAGEISQDLKALFLADMALVVDFKDKDDKGVVSLLDLDMGVQVGKSEEVLLFDLDTYLKRVVETKTLPSQAGYKTTAKQTRFYERWWFWTTIGVVCASGALALALLLPKETLPSKAPQEGKGAILIRF
jgi:hypothetical protein